MGIVRDGFSCCSLPEATSRVLQEDVWVFVKDQDCPTATFFIAFSSQYIISRVRTRVSLIAVASLSIPVARSPCLVLDGLAVVGTGRDIAGPTREVGVAATSPRRGVTGSVAGASALMVLRRT